MHLNFIMNIPGLGDVKITKMEQVEDRMALHVELEVKPQRCQEMTQRIHDYRIQKIKHLKWFERLTFLFYKKRRYACGACGKKFAERNFFIDRYQRFSKEWDQAVHMRSVKAKTFKEVAGQYGASASTITRRFDALALQEITETAKLPRVITIDEYKFCRYIYWALDGVRRRVQKNWNDYDRKKGKRMRHVFYKNSEKLTKKDRWYLKRYLEMDDEPKQAYELEEADCVWFRTSKKEILRIFSRPKKLSWNFISWWNKQAFLSSRKPWASSAMADGNLEQLFVQLFQWLFGRH